MLTIFTTAKPFIGHVGITQRNALRSWTRLSPECRVILFGDVPGAREIARELGIQHLPAVLRSDAGSTRLDCLFARAQEISRTELLCYTNCDIIFLDCFLPAIAAVANGSKSFLMIGQRWDTPIDEPVNFDRPDWRLSLRAESLRRGRRQFPGAVDYFVFPRGTYRDVPPFVIGRVCWDHWLVWKARSMNVPVVDAGADVLAIHQNHDFSYHPRGLDGVRRDIESKGNHRLAGGLRHLYTIEHATHRLVGGRIEDKPGRWHVPFTFLVRTYASQVWYAALKMTFKFRHALGLNRTGLSGMHQRVRSLLDDRRS